MTLNNKKPFAIKFSRKNQPIEQVLFYELLTKLTKEYEGFKVEGINTEKRLTKVVGKNPLLEIRDGKDYVEYGKITEKERNIIGVGLSKKYAVSFEPIEDITLSKGGCVDVYSVPVYDIVKHYETIVEKVKAYAEANFRKKCEPKVEKINVRVHSNFVRVNNTRLEHDEHLQLEEFLNKSFEDLIYSTLLEASQQIAEQQKATEYQLKNAYII